MHAVKLNNFRHAAIVPLIGGFSIAATNITKNIPEAIFSYDPFFENDKLYLRYLAKFDKYPPYYPLDNHNNPDRFRNYKNLDFITGVPPCSGLSMSGNLGKGERGTSPVNEWMYKAANFVLNELRPTIYTFENAPTLYTDAGEIVRNKLIEIARCNGYTVTFYKTDTLLHGIPQKRPRTYIIFYKGKFAPILEYEHKETQSVEEYLKSIPENATLQNKYATKEPFIKDFEIVKFCRKKFGNNWRQEFLNVRDHLTSYDFLNRKNLLNEFKDFVEKEPNSNPSSIKDINHVIKKLEMGKNFRLSHRVLCIDKHHIYSIVGEMMERNIHPVEDRRMNIREYMHLMGMPHDYDLLEPREYGKLPQNTPVTTCEFIIKEIIEIIKGNRNFSNEIFNYQNNIKHEPIKNKLLF